MNDEELIKETMRLDYSQLVMHNVYMIQENKRLNKNKNDVIEFIERYLKLNLEAFDTKSLLNKILEIIERGDYIDSD